MPNQIDSTTAAGLKIRLTINNHPTPIATALPEKITTTTLITYSLIPLVIYFLLVVTESMFAEKISSTGAVMALKRLNISLATIRIIILCLSLIASIIIMISTRNFAEVLYVILFLGLLIFEIARKGKK